jgi:hypothetical protein
MPAKMPSQNKLLYTTGATPNGGFANVGVVNLPKDLSIVNRRGYDHTDSKGVPYTFKVAVHWMPSGLDGTGYVIASASADTRTTVKFLTVANNWVAKNAGISWHKARNASLKRAGVKMSHLGAYAKTIRYNWLSDSTTFLDPIDGAGAALAGGTWDTTTVFNGIDENGFRLKLIGAGDDEDVNVSTTDINALHSYLQSRATVLPDSNIEISDVPSGASLLLATRDGSDSDVDESQSVRLDVRGAQDNPPYDEFDGSELNNDITEPLEAGRLVMYPSSNSPIMTTVFEVPYGIFEVQLANRDPDDNSGVVDDFAFSVEVLDIYPMQG